MSFMQLPVSRSVVQSALGLVPPAPAPGPRILPREDRAGAGHAADRLVALVEERVERHVVVGDVAPHVEVRPGGDGVDLYQPADVPADDGCAGARRGFGPAQAAHPGVLVGQGTVELADLHRGAAVLRIGLPEAL